MPDLDVFMTVIESVLQIISPTMTDFLNVFYIIIPPIYNIIFQIMLVVLLLFCHIGFTLSLRNLFTAHNISHRW